MKKIFYKLYASLMMVAFLFAACSPDSNELEAPDVTADDLVEGIAYTITHDGSNPNIVYLESKIGSKYTPVWEHPQGRSQEQKITLKIPFDGTYTVKFGVETRGGVVYGEPVTFTVDDFCADFVTGEMWDFLAGGAGHAKTWVPDNGNYGMKQGFYSCFDPSATYLDMVTDNGTNWYPKDKVWWEPGNGDVGITEDDLNSYMTFSLEGKAGLTVHRFTEGQEAVSEGLFSMNTDNHTMSAVDVDFVHGAWADGKAVDFRNGFQILLLTENQLMIANYRDEALSGEGRCIYCWNFVSKEYADNYVPTDEPKVDPVPDINGDGNEIITTSKSKTWILSVNSPYNWTTLAGDMLNDFNKPEDYNNGWAAYDEEMITATKFVFTASSSNGGTYTLSSYENEDREGTYTIDKNNDITFDQPINVLISHTNWGWDSNTYMTTTAENKLRIIRTKVDVLGNVTDMWLGCRSTEKDEYTAYHFEVGSGSPSPIDPVKELKKRLSGGSTLTYKVDLAYPFCWAYKPEDASTHSIKADEAFPDWTGWTSAAYQYVEKMKFTFNQNGSMKYIAPDGTATDATYEIMNADSGYGIDIVKFVGFDINPETPVCYTGPGGWVNFCFNENPDGLLANAPTDAGWLELYEWEYDENGNVAGLWFGIVQGDNGTINEGAVLTNQRRIFHFVVDK